jgi:L-methionine (R)-S-oxide reductase
MIRHSAGKKASSQISTRACATMPIHTDVFDRVESLLEDEDDWVSAMSTVACELHNSFEHFHWTGFYRTVEPDVLKIGPYQGGHGCLVIPFDRGICGAAARTGKTQDVPDVHSRIEHIACSSTTLSEVVVPIKNSSGQVVAVLDLDSDLPAAFTATDISFAEHLCQYLGAKYF